MRQLGPQTETLQRIKRLADSRTPMDEPTYACPYCLDTGFILTERDGPTKVYGHQSAFTKKPQPQVAYSRRCSCKTGRPPVTTKTDDGIPI